MDASHLFVFSASGGMGPTAKVVYKKLASIIISYKTQSVPQSDNKLALLQAQFLPAPLINHVH